MKSIRKSSLLRLLLLTPDFLSSYTGLTIAPIFFFASGIGLLFFIIFIAPLSFLGGIESKNVILSGLILFVPILVLLKKPYPRVSEKYLYVYLVFLLLVLMSDIFQVREYVFGGLYKDQLGWSSIGRFAGLSQEPSYFADTFFPVFVLSIAKGSKRLKVLSIVTLCLVFWCSQAKTLVQDSLIMGLIYLFFWTVISLKTYSRMFYTLIFIFILALTIIAIKNMSFLDHIIAQTYSVYGSWRTVSNSGAIIASDMINIPIIFDFSRLREVCLGHYNIADVSAIFSSFSYICYFFGWLLVLLWSSAICLIGLPKTLIGFDGKCYLPAFFTLLFIYMFFSAKWNFIYVIAIKILKSDCMGEQNLKLHKKVIS